MFNFPDAPIVGQRYQPSGGAPYIWDGVKWSTTSANYVSEYPSDKKPVMDGVANAGSLNLYARGDHVHPSDTSRAPINNATFTGTLTSALLTASGNVTINGKITSNAKGHRIGMHGGAGAGGVVTKDDANLLFYDHSGQGSPGSWCGFGADSSGNLWLRTGYSEGAIPIFYVRNDQVMVFRDPPLAPTPAAGDNSQKIATTAFVKSRSGGGSYLPLAGGTVNGNMTIAGDLWVHNNGNYGVVYLSNTDRYLQWSGSSYNFAGASVYAGQGRIWGTGDWGGNMPYNNARLAHVGDFTYPLGAQMQEPYGGSVITGTMGAVGSPISSEQWVRRFRQVQYYTNGWFAIGYA